MDESHPPGSARLEVPVATDIQIVASDSGSRGSDVQGLDPDDADDGRIRPAATPSASGGDDDQMDVAEDESARIEEKEYEDFRASGFAKKGELAHWFPQIEDDEAKSWRIWLSKRSRVLLLQIVLVGGILVTNFGLTLFAVTHYESSNGVGVIYQGDCDTVKSLDLWLHLLINILGTGMLSASNYCMQLQAAPTRENINKAHENKKWLDIGVPSLRNFWYVSNWRRFSWILLALSSVPVHLIYNSAVFQSLLSSDYTVAVVNDAFINGGDWNLTAAESRRQGDPGWSEWRENPTYLNYTDIIHTMQNEAKSYIEKNVTECFDIYEDYFARQGNVVILAKNLSVKAQVNDSLLIYVSIIPRFDDWPKNLWALENGTEAFLAVQPTESVLTWYLGPLRYEVDKCLVQTPTDDNWCRFEYSPQIMFTVCLLNLTKTMIMLCIWTIGKWQSKKQRDPHKEILYTLGDTIASFMRDPDESTESMCLATKNDFLSRRTLKNRFVKEEPTPSQNPREWQEAPKFWMSSASYRRWFVLIFLCGLVLVIAASLLGIAIESLQHRNFKTTIPDLWSLGFGSLTPLTYLQLGLPRSNVAGLIANVLIANLPQMILSILYIFYNSVLSCFLVQREFSRLCRVRKPLRVSEPIGIQRSSYFISMPLRYGIPLYMTSGIMHWLISQSLFLARITALSPDGTEDVNSSFSTCGYSPIAIFITIIVGTALVIAIVLIGFRKYEGTMPLVATNSRAISAACHILPEDRPDGYLLPVQWGVVEVKGGVGHTAFTTAYMIRNVEAGSKYA